MVKAPYYTFLEVPKKKSQKILVRIAVLQSGLEQGTSSTQV
jgi:hypothetical protein